MSRFFVSRENIGEGSIALSPDDIQHMRVLRIGSGETFTVCDGEGTDYLCRFTQQGVAAVLETFPSEGEPSVECKIYAAFPKGDKTEEITQKAVQLGVSEVIMFPSSRCVSKPDTKALDKKLSRWQKISEEAAKQSGRGRIPEVRAFLSFAAAVEEAVAAQMPLFLYEDEQRLRLGAALDKTPDFKTAAVVTGPEGGFDPHEVEYARTQGMHIVTLGKRILRCETAPIAALTAAMFFSGNL